ncbi:MAG: M20/M25/M40 family metallo-hydrolase [Anaerolineales bacterium]|nr:M20/M25/M40 family metallo-hydrolase [Anaerolineales bacterium]
MNKKTQSPIYDNPAELLRQLIRFDTTNPPGDERECILFINGLLKEAGIKTTLLGKNRHRQNVIARLKGEGTAPPLLLYGHVDVVTTEKQKWQQPPFEANIVDGFIWGRGALDMKSGVAMLLAAFLKAKTEGASLPGDVIFCAVADEEAGGNFGARFLVEEHPGLFEGVKYAFGEFGGFNMSMGGKRIYPVMVAEKQACWMKATIRGQGGHGSMPVHGEAMAKLARALRLLDAQHLLGGRNLPYHLTPGVRVMLESIAAALGGVTGLLFRQLTNPLLADRLVKALGPRVALFAPLLHNTVSPTMLRASNKVNVIPSEIELGLDGRLLPGFKPEDMIRELRALLGDDFDLEIVMFDPGPAEPDMGLFDTLGAVLRELDPKGVAVPLVMSGVTDARFLSRLGIQTYGFTPLKLPDDFNFIRTIHAADERVPVDALDFGLQAIFKALQRFH